jgi:hypothetical protein
MTARPLATLALLAACTAPATPTPTPTPAPPRVAPPAPAPVEPTAPVPPTAPAAPAAPAAPPTPPTLAAGPDRFGLPVGLRGGCVADDPPCGVHIVDLAARTTTTLWTRDVGATWHVRSGREDRPVAVEFVEVPADPRVAAGAELLFPGARVAGARLPDSDLELWHEVAAAAGDRFYAVAREDAYQKIHLHEIDADGAHRRVDLRGSSPQLVYPTADGLALVTYKKQYALDLFDPVARKVTAKVPIPGAADKECARVATESEVTRLLVLADPPRAYVGFRCIVVGK